MSTAERIALRGYLSATAARAPVIALRGYLEDALLPSSRFIHSFGIQIRRTLTRKVGR